MKQSMYMVGMCVCLLLGSCAKADAAEISFMVVSNPVPQDPVTIVEVYLDPKGESLNAVEGIVGLHGGGADVVSGVVVETGGSALSLWPVIPSYATAEQVIRFTGGATEPVVQKELLFRMRIFSEKSGDVSVSWLGGAAYMSDGEGTPIGISSRSLTIALSPSTPNQINASSQDSIPPYFETVEVSHDPDTFDGKYFLSFHAVDDLSGIARYEVVEDNVTTEVMNSVYVLRDQERNSKIIIIVYDQAGNSASIKVPTKYESLILWGGFGLVLLTVLLVVIIYRRQIRSVFRRFI